MNHKIFALIGILLCLLARAGGANTMNQNELSLSYDNLLLVEVYINRINTGETIEIYQHNGGYLVPLGLISSIIDFPIDVDVDQKTASGWFISESKTFSLDQSRGEVIIEGIRKNIDATLMKSNYDDLYVDSSFFADWFGIDIALNFSDLALILKPREKIPVQLRFERDQLRSKVQKRNRKKKTYEIVDKPYQAYEMPFVDVGVGYNYSNSGNTFNSVSYSVLSQGDLAYMTSQIAISGENSSDEEDDSLTGFRFNLSREDRNGELLGKMNAKSLEVGDITAVSLPLATTSGRGRGFSVSNVSLDRPDQFDSTDFIGDEQPGWEVEIYRNGVLQDFQIVGNNGSYEFRNVPIFFGNNIFRIVSYGPQGQVKERTERYNIDNSILQKGEFNYQVSVDEKSRSIFGVDEGGRELQHKEGVRLVGEAEYGIADRVTAGIGFARTPLNDGQFHEYSMFSLKNSFAGALTELNFVYDLNDGGMAAKFAANTELKGLRIRAEQSFYDDFISEVELAQINKRISVSKLDINGSFNYLSRVNVSYRFGGDYETFEDDREIITLRNRLSTSLYGVSISNSLELREIREANDTSRTTVGQFSIRGRHKDFSVRLNTDYNVDPLLELKAVNLTAQKKVRNKANVIVGIRRDLSGGDETSINSSINRRFENFTWSLIAQADSNDNISAGTRISFSLGKEPRQDKWFIQGDDIASNGAASATAFLDNNYNDIFDDGDEQIENVAFLSRSKRVEGEGLEPVLITQMPSGTTSNIELDMASLDNPFWTPKKQGYTVFSRPGNVIEVDFPVVITTEIDGTVFLEKNGNVRPVSRVDLELVDENGNVKYTSRSEFDGFYIVSGIIPGEYLLRVAPNSLQRLKAYAATEKKLSINKESDILSNIDITLFGNTAQKNESIDNEIAEKHCYEPGCYAPGVPSIE